MEHPRTLLRQIEQRARKRFGQHFLVSEPIVERIVACADVHPGQRVLEVGPGLGVLTERLLQAQAQVRAVELDRDLAEFLRERHPQLDLVQGDVLRQDYSELLADGPWRVVSNLPYNVGTRVVTSMLERHAQVDRLIVMLQREVAERLVAEPGSKAYGSLSVMAAAHSARRIAMFVPPGAFHPPPKVESAVIELRLQPPPAAVAADPQHFQRVVRAAFSARRKTIANSMRSAFDRDVVREALERSGIDPKARAEVVDAAAFVALAEALR